MKLYGRMLLWFLLANVATAIITVVVGSWLLEQMYSEADARLDGDQAVQIFESKGMEGLQRWLATKREQEGLFGMLRDGHGEPVGARVWFGAVSGFMQRGDRGELVGSLMWSGPDPGFIPRVGRDGPVGGHLWSGPDPGFILRGGRDDPVRSLMWSGPDPGLIPRDDRDEFAGGLPAPPPRIFSLRSEPPRMSPFSMMRLPPIRQSVEITSASGKSYRWEGSKRPPEGIWGQVLDVSVRIGIGLLVLAAVALLATRRIIKPIRNLEIATEALAAGDFKARAPAGLSLRRDEIGSLARSFSQMAVRIGHLLESQRRLLRDVSHELRSPLARLTLAAELAREQKKPEYFDRIQQEVQRLEELIAQILTLARMEAALGQRAGILVNLDDLLSQICNDTGFEAHRRGITVKADLAANCAVDGELPLLRAAFENVIRNAVRYTADRTEVSVRLYRKNDKACISVCDRGPGVPPEKLAVIFEPFMRVSEARERDSGGYGIGLTIAREALRAHGGEIAASLRDSGGLCIEMELPVRPAAPAGGAGE
jgi:signal transduction histidine kinase